VLTLVPWVLVWKGPVIREKYGHPVQNANLVPDHADIVGQESHSTTIRRENWLRLHSPK
jgi:hypothetical protein